MPIIRQTVRPGTTARLDLELDTTAAEQNGKGGAFTLQEAILRGASVVDLESAESWTMPAMVEQAYPVSGGVTASVTGTPAYSAGAGPSSENIYILAVDDTTGFLVGDFIRAQLQPADQGQVYEVLAVPDGTTLHVHCKNGGMDIVNGDTIEEVTPTGVYRGYFELDVDDYLNAGQTNAAVTAVITTVASGVDPKFSSSEELSWTWALELDVGSNAYRAG